MKPWHGLLFVLLLTVVAYRGVWSATFVYEDENAVFANPAVTGAERIQVPRARMVTALSHRLVWKAWPKSARAAHIVNLALHIVNGVLVYAIAVEWIAPWAAVLTASLFLLHPIQVEAVAYVASRSELLACCFALLAFWAAPLARRWWHHGLVWLAVVLAVCAKESSAIIVPLMVVRDLYEGRSLSWARLAAVVVPIGLMAWSVSHYEYVFQADAGHVDYAATQAYALGRYLGLVLVPWGFSIDHDFDLVPWALKYAALAAWLAVACLPVVALASVANEDRSSGRLWDLLPRLRVVAFAWAWLLVACLPRFLVPLNEALNEHQLYVPMVGLWLMVGALCEGWLSPVELYVAA